MNYEELLQSRNGTALAKEHMPFGQLYKKMTDGKYANVIDLRDDLTDSLIFNDAIESESAVNARLQHKGQLHFTLAADSAGLYGVTVEPGTYRTLARQLDDTPAIVATGDFIVSTVKQLLALTAYLHDQGVYHICYAPDNVLLRKGDHQPMLLFHGSAYQTVNDQEALYGDDTAYIAPEVIEEGIFDARADIYSIGCLMRHLYRQATIPRELRGVIDKATQTDPERRYQTPEEMARAIDTRRAARRTLLTLLATAAAALLITGLYSSLQPEREDIEFVKPAPRQSAADDGYQGYNPAADFGGPADTLMIQADARKMKEYQAKAEQIFRKQFTDEADRILSRIYNNDRMSRTERNFMAVSQSTMEELVRTQARLAIDAGLSEERSQVIAGQIIDQVTARLKADMKQRQHQRQVDSYNNAPAKQQQRPRRQEDKSPATAQTTDEAPRDSSTQ